MLTKYGLLSKFLISGLWHAWLTCFSFNDVVSLPKTSPFNFTSAIYLICRCFRLVGIPLQGQLLTTTTTTTTTTSTHYESYNATGIWTLIRDDDTIYGNAGLKTITKSHAYVPTSSTIISTLSNIQSSATPSRWTWATQ